MAARFLESPQVDLVRFLYLASAKRNENQVFYSLGNSVAGKTNIVKT